MIVCVVGRGKVGRALTRALREAGVACSLQPGTRRKAPRARADVWLLAVPDAAIEATTARLAPRLDARASVLHLAGARGLEVLAPARGRGASVGVMHPLVSFAGANASLGGVTFTCFGQRAALASARRLARALAARAVIVAPPDASYHAAAALVANGAAALAHVGAEVLATLGFTQRDAALALAALLRSVADNVAAVGVPAALTGPVVRGDAATVARHLAALGARNAQLAHAYASLQPIVVRSARAAGLDAAAARRVLRAAQLSK